MKVRLAEEKDINRILEIYLSAVRFMRANGNFYQWAGSAAVNRAEVERNIRAGRKYVVESTDGKDIAGCFALFEGPDPTYGIIDRGSWISDEPYIAIHRVASSGIEPGVTEVITEYTRARYDHLRIDTSEDNIPMRKALARNNFDYRGIIYLKNGDPRFAFEWVRGQDEQAQ